MLFGAVQIKKTYVSYHLMPVYAFPVLLEKISAELTQRKWYANMGHRVLDATDREIIADGGFTSEHYTEHRIRELLGPCELHSVGDIAYIAQC